MSPRNRGSDCTCSLYDIGSFDLFASAWPLQLYLHVVLIMYTEHSDEISLHTRASFACTQYVYTQMRTEISLTDEISLHTMLHTRVNEYTQMRSHSSPDSRQRNSHTRQLGRLHTTRQSGCP